jgi:hypothetical protein
MSALSKDPKPNGKEAGERSHDDPQRHEAVEFAGVMSAILAMRSVFVHRLAARDAGSCVVVRLVAVFICVEVGGGGVVIAFPLEFVISILMTHRRLASEGATDLDGLAGRATVAV